MGREKRIILTVIAIGVVVTALIVYLGIVQTFKQMRETQTKIDEKQREINDYTAKQGKIDGLKKKKEKIDEVVESFAKILPNDATEENWKLLDLLDQYSSETTTRVKDFRYVPPEGKEVAEQPAFIRHRFRLEIEGHFFDLARLVNLIERTEKFLKIDSFRFSRLDPSQRKEEGDLTELAAQVNLSTYTYDYKKRPAAGPR
jgi:Tfp pilus assembly protein PilO